MFPNKSGSLGSTTRLKVLIFNLIARLRGRIFPQFGGVAKINFY